jgi:RimJ/RimL family protein N-acetyltransferase
MELETERLILREYVADDWQAVLRYQADARYWRFYHDAGTRGSEAGARAFVQTFIAWQREQPRTRYQLAVTLRNGGRLVGSCGLRVRRLVDHGRADAGWEGDIGYEIDPALWSRGYATEAARRIVAFAFAELGLHRVWSYCLAENVASARVLEKAGLRLEGRLRENEWFQERWWDSLVYGMLVSDRRESDQTA